MEEIYEKLLASKKYRDVCPDTLRRVAEDCAMRYRKPKEAEKAAKEALHGITGAFMDANSLRRAREYLSCSEIEAALTLHSSTRERMPLDEFYRVLFEKTGRPTSVLDVACGLNPIYLGSVGVPVTGIDIAGAQIALINEWAQACGAPIRCEARDALSETPFLQDEFDLALIMKLLPVLENQKKGAAAALLERVPAQKVVVTFPTRTLGGRSVGMENHYSTWFESLLPETMRILERYTFHDELIYLIQK